MDPYLPILKREGNQVGVDGIALFKSDQFVGSIPFERMFPFNLLVQKFNNGVFSVHKGMSSAVIENIRGRRKIKVSYKSGVPVATVYINLTGIVREFKGEEITSKKLTKLNKDFEGELKKECQSVIQKLQKLNVDPVGFGEAARSQNRGFNLAKWHEDYPDMKVTVVVDTKLTEFGIER
jgi:spore germination protein